MLYEFQFGIDCFNIRIEVEINGLGHFYSLIMQIVECFFVNDIRKLNN